MLRLTVPPCLCSCEAEAVRGTPQKDSFSPIPARARTFVITARQRARRIYGLGHTRSKSEASRRRARREGRSKGWLLPPPCCQRNGAYTLCSPQTKWQSTKLLVRHSPMQLETERSTLCAAGGPGSRTRQEFHRSRAVTRICDLEQAGHHDEE